MAAAKSSCFVEAAKPGERHAGPAGVVRRQMETRGGLQRSRFELAGKSRPDNPLSNYPAVKSNINVIILHNRPFQFKVAGLLGQDDSKVLFHPLMVSLSNHQPPERASRFDKLRMSREKWLGMSGGNGYVVTLQSSWLPGSVPFY